MSTLAKKEAYRRNVIKQFKYGMRIPVSKHIWDKVLSELDENRQDQVALRFEVPESAVTRGKKQGQLSMENLVVMLSELGWEFEHLGEMPGIETRVQHGYLQCVKDLKQEEGSLSVLELEAITIFLADSGYYEAMVRGNQLSEECWQRLKINAMRVWRERSHLKLIDFPIVSEEQFLDLRSRYAKVVCQIAKTIPFKWASTRGN